MLVAGESQAVDLSFRVELVKEPLGEVLAVLDEQVVGQVETITLVKVDQYIAEVASSPGRNGELGSTLKSQDYKIPY